jgi:SAM-dependent methyltransferase
VTDRDRAAGSLQTFAAPRTRAKLADLTLVEVTAELVARLQGGETFVRDQDIVLAGQLEDLLAGTLDIHLNRFSRRRCYDVIRPVLDVVPMAQVRDATIVDLGSGSLNPFVFGFLFLLFGARRAYAIDLEPPQDLPRAVRALAAAASWMLTDPTRIAGHHAVDRDAVWRRLEGFDLARLAAGDPAGIDDQRLVDRRESIYDLSLADGEADIVSTVSLLEHLDRVDDALDVLRRVTRPGGVGHHIVDFIDHRLYGGEVDRPLAFLTIDSPDPLVHDCNRLRCAQMRGLFEAHGFTVDRVEPSRTDPVTAEERRQFVEPFRSMPLDDLGITCARFVVRRR